MLAETLLISLGILSAARIGCARQALLVEGRAQWRVESLLILVNTRVFLTVNVSSPQLNLVVLRSDDIERAVAFYRKTGLLFTRHAHGLGPEHYTSLVSGLVFEIYPASSKFPSTEGTRIGFRVGMVDDVVRRLSENGAEIVTPPADGEWGRRAVVKDFDGHVVEPVTPLGTAA